MSLTTSSRNAGNSKVAGDHAGRAALLAVAACFFLSGFAALLYQIAWLRQFAIVFGTSELAVATVLAAYMGGLALGAVIVARFVDRITQPVLIYGLLEAGIAISALAVPLLLAGAGALYGGLLGDRSSPPDAASLGQVSFYLLVAFMVLATPTALMGATFPLLVRHAVRTDTQIGPRVALLYAINTCGAVCGIVAAGFVLLPALGLSGTVWVGVCVNILIFAVAAALSKYFPGTPLAMDGSTPGNRSDARATGFFRNCVCPLLRRSSFYLARFHSVFREQPAWILPIIMLSGSNAFLYEVLWTRLINHILGGSIYAFATMLASFLSGISIGGAIAGRFSRQPRQAAIGFAVAQVAIAACSIVVYALIGRAVPESRGLIAGAAFSAAVMLPSTIFIGATFPLAVRIIAGNAQDVAGTSAGVYAWNTFGAILGAILGGFWLIPAFGFSGSIRLAVSLNLLLALATLLWVSPRRLPYTAAVAAALMLVIGVYHPQRPLAVLTQSPMTSEPLATKEMYFAVGRSATVFLAEADGWATLRTNGLPEAWVSAKGAPPVRQNQRWLTALPVAARPDAKSMLVVGFGGGVALGGVPATVRDVDVVELEPEVINANRAIAGFRSRDPLSDPRIHVVLNDARNALRLTSKQYDIIVSQPSHPWTAGASHLFTREFMQLASDHLVEDGVFVQWMNIRFVDESLLRSLAATLLDVYAYVRVYMPDPGVLLFLASDRQLDLEQQLASTGRPLSDDLLHYASIGMNGVEDYLAALALDEAGVEALAAAAPMSTDNRNRMATHSRFSGDGLTMEDLARLFESHDPLLHRSSWIWRKLGDRINVVYMESRLLDSGLEQRANALANSVPDRSTALLMHATGLSHNGAGGEAPALLHAAIAADPSNMQARFALVQNNLGLIVSGRASEDLISVAKSLSGTPAAVLEGWYRASSRDWQGLANLDQALARADPTDLWYPYAAQLRAEWRTRVVGVGGDNQAAVEALRLIDRALMIVPRESLLELRIVCGQQLRNPDVFVESIRELVFRMQKDLERARLGTFRYDDADLESALARASGLAKLLDAPIAAPLSDRAKELQETIYKLLIDLRDFES